MSKIPFRQRFGLEQSKPIDDDFPETARTALAYLIVDLQDKGSISDWSASSRVLNELLRTGRFTEQDFSFDNTTFFQCVLSPLQKMEWWQVYTFCERLHDYHIGEAGYLDEVRDPTIDVTHDVWVTTTSKADMQKYYADELNNILAEEQLAYHFVNGQFQRRGRAQTQKSIQRMGAVLADPSLSSVRAHYNKARKFFDERPEPDAENCVKEALCALEACLETLTDKPASQDFTKVLKQLRGNDTDQIPSPVVEGMIKLHAYRGSGQGVAHAATQGSRVSEIEAELVLNLVASYVTYLVDLLSKSEDIPF